MRPDVREHRLTPSVRALADQAFSRAAGAPLVGGNCVRLLKDAHDNYPAWLAAIAAARHHVHFESYIIHEDAAGAMFADALSAAAGRGVAVRLIYDWMGALGRTSRRFWNRLRANGVEVRCYNPPRFDAPFGWISRDHRKMIAVDGEVGFVAGLCIGRMWLGEPARKLDPWRDTGIEVRGPAVADIERAFAQVWGMIGPTLPKEDVPPLVSSSQGSVSLRIVAAEPATAGILRVDQLIAALARERVWLTDAYYAGTTLYVQALRSAARSGVDVRLLVPNGTDIPILRPLSRAGYRPLLEAGVRVFEWNGTMLHAKTAVADGRWARVGSTNLNISSWLGNYELDAVIEDAAFARQMEEMYLEDLGNATEVVLEARRVRRRRRPPSRLSRPVVTSGGGSAGRAAAGAVRIGSTIGAAFTNRRTLEPIESRLAVAGGVLLLALAVLFWFLPAVLIYPVVVIFAWVAVSLLYKGYKLHRQQTRT